MLAAYKKIKIYYFSGTGNSERISLWIQSFSTDWDIDCQLINIADVINRKKPLELENDMLIMIISPIHGFNYPKITLDFIRHFPKGQNNVILMNTRAGMKIRNIVTPGLTGIAFLVSAFILKGKGYHIKGLIPFDMPSNWLFIHPALSRKAVLFIHKKNYQRVKEYCKKIFVGQSLFKAYRDIIQDILISPISLAYYIAGRFYFAKSYYASDLCNSCGLCVNNCPVQAIKMKDKRPFWNFKCESCMKCMANCPQKTIDATHGLFVLVGIICAIIGSYLFSQSLPVIFQSGFIKIIIYSILFLVFLYVFYGIQHFLLKNKYIRKIVALSSLTHCKFWGRYKSVPDSTK